MIDKMVLHFIHTEWNESGRDLKNDLGRILLYGVKNPFWTCEINIKKEYTKMWIIIMPLY